MSIQSPMFEGFPYCVLVEPSLYHSHILNFPATVIDYWCDDNIGEKNKKWISSWRWYAFSSIEDMVFFKLTWENLDEKYLLS